MFQLVLNTRGSAVFKEGMVFIYTDRLNHHLEQDLYKMLKQENLLAEDWEMDYNQNHPYKSLLESP